jgi:hypothetical protein
MDPWDIALVAFFFGCLAALPVSVVVRDRLRARRRQPRTGGIFSMTDGKGEYKIAKVLVVDPSAVHVRIYAGGMSRRPTRVKPGDLRLGGDDPGIGHLPVTHAVFAKGNPQLIAMDAVLPEELDGYDMWKEAGGNVWGEEHRPIRPGRIR